MRQCKTSAEERALIAKESAAIRASLKEDQSSLRHRNVAKLMYMHMLGYPTHFGQMECVKLIATPGFPEKRVGYLGLMILLDERQEVTMLVTNSIKNDLGHKNAFVVGCALCALGNICTAEMARDVAPEVAQLLHSKISYVRKKAALCAVRVIKKVPELAESFVDGAEALLDDRYTLGLSQIPPPCCPYNTDTFLSQSQTPRRFARRRDPDSDALQGHAPIPGL